MSARIVFEPNSERSATVVTPAGEFLADVLCRTAGIKDYRQRIPVDLIGEATERIRTLAESRIDPDADRTALVARIVNEKFDVNAGAVADFYALAAHQGVTFNYHQKILIVRAFNMSDAQLLDQVLTERRVARSVAQTLAGQFAPAPYKESFALLRRELKSPTLTRKDSKPRDRSEEIMAALYSAFVYRLFSEQHWHAINDPVGRGQKYEPDFWKHLHRNFPRLFSRDRSLEVRKVSRDELDGDYRKLVNQLAGEIKAAFAKIANHGTYAVLIPTDSLGRSGRQWQLFGDVVLYAEKHHTSELKQGFFRWQQIRDACKEYVPDIDDGAARFQELNFGFQYLDCFVIGDGVEQRILVLLQKHVADETLIPCPACRSHVVQGNSYSSLGVKSWECNNQFCPDRSKFNRGKRYSFLQLLKQEAITDDRNLIPSAHVKGWMRDVQPNRTDDEVLELLVRHFSLAGDTVYLRGFDDRAQQTKLLERVVRTEPIPKSGSVAFDEFEGFPLFKRYVIDRREPANVPAVSEKVGLAEARLGDSFEVLASIPEATFDGAVTSPPYYNAREYSQWANIYTYLFDMYNITRQVFRVLKPGGVYLFNIFDYFDNENTISLSAMGEKRMILGPYMLDIFRRVGFECVGNIVWDKGDIEGKRGFNGGNFSPYYQAPFNCWEHILVLAKPGAPPIAGEFPALLELQPVIKMVRGENRHGHTAPYPEGIPYLLAERLGSGARMLDPFGGSMTTSRAASLAGVTSLCVERDPQYFQLGLDMLRNAGREQELL